MSDPQPHGRPGILSAAELAACVRILRACQGRPEATVVLVWDDLEQRAWASLVRAGYGWIAAEGRHASYRWSKLEITDAGLDWLEQADPRN